MKFALFYHSLVSCWNHGNAHFLRGYARALAAGGHAVTVYEPHDGWSRANALADDPSGLAPAELAAPGVETIAYGPDFDVRTVRDCDVVVTHEWNAPSLVAALGALRADGARFTLLFHDTHHRAITAPHEIERFDLRRYDGVLAFGRSLADVYRKNGWAKRVFCWHEAADVALFNPPAARTPECDLVWIGNWGDSERDEELREFLLRPVRALGLRARVYGVRYPERALRELAAAGIDYRGWLPNHRAPAAFAAARMTVHVPRRPYARALPGIPTIRMFEALACGVPLVSAPWDDCERLFPQGAYLEAPDGDAMTEALARLRDDDDFAHQTAERGLAAIRARHTCAHRANELIAIVEALQRERNAAMEGAPS